MKKITTLILASSLLLVATTSVKADDNFEMPTRYVKMSENQKHFIKDYKKNNVRHILL